MANTIAVSSLIAKAALPILENNLKAAGLVNREYENEWEKGMSRGYMPGQTINIKKPSRYSYRAGNLAVPQDTVISTVPATLQMGGVDLGITSLERTVSISKSEQYELMIEPAMETIANEIDRQGLDLMRRSVPNIIGTPGTTPNTQATANAAWGNVNQRLNELATSGNYRNFIMAPSLYNGMNQGQLVGFNPADGVSKAYRTGQVIDALGFTNAMDQNVAVHTNGSQNVTALTVGGANQTGSTLTLTAVTTGTITRGTKITIPSRFQVNPQNRQSTGASWQATITADVPIGSATLPIDPPITPSGNFQNIDASPANAAPITIFGTASGSYTANVAFQKNAFTLAMVPLFTPGMGSAVGGAGKVTGVENANYKGFNMSIIEVFDYTSRSFYWRFDVLFAWAALRPETAIIYAT